jgi:hypothetical protein
MCLFSGKGFAADFPGEIQVTPRLDLGAATVRDELSEPARSESLISGFGFTLGYLAPFHLIVEAGVHFQEEFPAFLGDSAFKILELSVQAGVDVPLGNGWHLAPKFGRVHVRVDPPNEGFRASGEPSSGIAKSERDSNVYELSLRKDFDAHFALGVSYRELALPDGRERTLGVEAAFRF